MIGRADCTSESGALVSRYARRVIVSVDAPAIQKAIYIVLGTAEPGVVQNGRLHLIRNHSHVIRHLEISSDLVVCGKYAGYAGQEHQAEHSASDSQSNHAVLPGRLGPHGASGADTAGANPSGYQCRDGI